jgi:hypothetical protein
MRSNPTRIHRLDYALGGGLPPGITMLWGNSGSCRTLFGLNLLKTVERGALIHLSGQPDLHQIETAWRADAPLFLPENGEAALSIAYDLVDNGCKVVVLDSLPGLQASSSFHAGFRKFDYIGTKHLLLHGFGELGRLAMARGATILTVNDHRRNVSTGKVQAYMWNTMRPLCSCILRTYREEYTTEYGTITETSIRIEAQELRRQPLTAVIETSVYWPHGFSQPRELMALMAELGIMERRGVYWHVAGVRLGPGYAAACEQLEPSMVEFEQLVAQHIREAKCQESK